MSNRDYTEKEADYCWDVIKFSVNLLLLAVPLFLTIFAALIAIQTSELVDEVTAKILKISVVILAIVLTGFAWTVWYLVKRSSKRFRDCMAQMAPDQSPRLDRARRLFMLVGTVACTIGTVILFVLALASTLI